MSLHFNSVTRLVATLLAILALGGCTPTPTQQPDQRPVVTVTTTVTVQPTPARAVPPLAYPTPVVRFQDASGLVPLGGVFGGRVDHQVAFDDLQLARMVSGSELPEWAQSDDRDHRTVGCSAGYDKVDLAYAGVVEDRGVFLGYVDEEIPGWGASDGVSISVSGGGLAGLIIHANARDMVYDVAGFRPQPYAGARLRIDGADFGGLQRTDISACLTGRA